MPDRLDLPRRYRDQIEALLREHVPGVEVWAYGSRVSGRSHEGSDLDLVLRGPDLKRIPSGQLADLIEALEQSNVPIIVQIHDWARLPESFHREIEREYVVLVEKEDERCLAGDWQLLRLSDAVHLIGGGTPKRSHTEYWGGLIPWLSVKDFNNDNRHVESTEESITELGLIKSSAKILKEGQLIISARGTVGALAQLSKPMAFNQSCYGIDAKPEYTTNDFLYYLIKHSIVDFKQVTHGAVFDTITRETFEHIWINLPPLPEQRAIAHILGTLDDKIELNRRMNETLEEMVRALFKSWFVDFDPVRAKMEGRDPGLPKHLADLFPDRLVDSELGPIPEGWEVGCFGDIVDQIRDNENPLASPDTVFHHFSIPAFDKNQWPQIECGEDIKSQKSRVPPEVILLSKLNPEVERVWFVDVASDERAICSTEFLVLQARQPFQRSYVYCFARSPFFRQQIESLVTGTSKSHQRAPAGAVLALEAIIPSTPVIRAFDQQASVLLDRTVGYRRETITLAAQRDALLPKLISGELRVTDVERHISKEYT